MSIETKIRKTIATGRISLGAKQAKRGMKKGDVKLFIIAKDCPIKKEIMEIAGNVPIQTYPGNSLELGQTCGKNFAVSIVSILDEGKSDILQGI